MDSKMHMENPKGTLKICLNEKISLVKLQDKDKKITLKIGNVSI